MNLFRSSTKDISCSTRYEPGITKCSFTKLSDSAQGTIQEEEDSDCGKTSDSGHLNSDIQDIINRLDTTQLSHYKICDENDEGFFSTTSSTTLCTNGCEEDVNFENVSYGEDVFDGDSYSYSSDGKGTNHVEVTLGQSEYTTSYNKPKRRSSEPTRKITTFESLRRKLSWSKTEWKSNRSTPAQGPAKPFTPGSVMRLEVSSLPQVFRAKYLGIRACSGIWGPEFTRGAVDYLITRTKSLEEYEDIPLVQLVISEKGIDARPCPTEKRPSFSTILLPIEFISYGVQDSRYTRVFTCIVVREMSWKGKKMECHAFLCESSLTARKLALSMALAFKVYTQVLQGKSFRFQLDLQPRSEEKMTRKNKSGRASAVECDA